MAEGNFETRLNPTLLSRIEKFLAVEDAALEEFPLPEAQKLVFELYAHQMELQLQNKELGRVQVVLERFLRLHEETRALLEAARGVLENRPFAHTAGAIFEACRRLTGATYGYVALLNENGREHEILCLESDGHPCPVDHWLPKHLRGLRGKSHHTGQAVYDNDFPRNTRRRSLPSGYVAPDNVLFAPLARGDKAVGWLILANKPGGFLENDARLATDFGELAAIALDNCRTLTALTQSEERFRSMAQTAIEAIISTDARGRIISWNQGAHTIFGYREEEVIDQPLTILLPEPYRTACRHRVDRRRSSRKTPFPGKAMELFGLRRDGGEFPLELSLSRWKAGGRRGYTAIIRDLSERRALESALKAAAHHWRTTFDAIGDGVFLVNRDSEILHCNRTMAGLLEKPFEEIIGRRCWEVVHQRSSPIDGCPFVRMMESRQRETLILSMSDCWFKIAVDPILDEAGNVSSAVHVITDITHQMQAQEALTASLAKLRRTLHGTVLALASAAETKDRYTAGHQRKVAQLACAIARGLGLNNEQVEGVRVISLLHDIGKIAVPAEILTKPGKITESEFNLIKNHSQVGYEILKQIEFPWPVALAVLQHHERLDGSGYPGGLRDPEICLEARIIAVADVVEAMSSHRPYRSALGIDQALEEIQQYKGVRYDPEVVDACIELFNEKGFHFDGEPPLVSSLAHETAADRGGACSDSEG